MRRILQLCLLLLVHDAAHAGSIPDRADIAYEPRIGAALPLKSTLRDDDGKHIYLEAVIDRRPLILTLGYFRCASLCSVLRINLLSALRQAHLVAGRDFSFAALSIDPSETPADALALKASELGSQQEVEHDHIHFLTGERDAAASVASAVGFKSRQIGENKFGHPLGVAFVSSSGVVSSYLFGVSFSAADVRDALRRASADEVTRAPAPLLLLCYDFDTKTGRYTFAIMKLLQASSVVAAAIAFVAFARVAFGEGRRR